MIRKAETPTSLQSIRLRVCSERSGSDRGQTRVRRGSDHGQSGVRPGLHSAKPLTPRRDGVLSPEYTGCGSAPGSARFSPYRSWQICCTISDRLLRKERVMKRFQTGLGLAVAGLMLVAAP